MNCLCLSFLVGPGTNQDQMKCEHVVKPCKTLSRHPHFCLIVIQPRSATDRLTLNQTKKKTWMLLPPPINWSQWINHDSHSWRAQNVLEFHSKLQGPPRTNLQKGLQELGSILIHLFQQDATVSKAWEKLIGDTSTMLPKLWFDQSNSEIRTSANKKNQTDWVDWGSHLCVA